MKHRVLVIGAGSIGERHVRTFLATGRAEVSICEPHGERCKAVAERYSVRAYDDLEASLAEAPDAAVVATPADSHVSIANRVASGGTHLLIEKPLSTGLEGVDALRETIARQRCVAAVGYVWRMHPMLGRMREAVVEGRFGKPLQLVVRGGQHFPTFRPAYRETYYTRRETGGGTTQDALTHMFNVGEWLVGPVDRIAADTSRQYLEGVEVEDTVHAITRQGDVMGCYSINQFQAPNELSVTVACERGTARFEAEKLRWRWMLEPDSGWQEEALDQLERDDMFVRQANAFVDALEGKAVSICTFDEGAQTLRVNLAALESADKGVWVKVS